MGDFKKWEGILVMGDDFEMGRLPTMQLEQKYFSSISGGLR